ncbi:MAG: hypothetical protein K0S39_5578, partial [Paenibacillus sp.]|nr:hypothetical protein [Paenibacillus sp.]
ESYEYRLSDLLDLKKKVSEGRRVEQ